MKLEQKSIGRVVAQVRQARKLTQRQLAERIGVSVSYLSLLENGARGASIQTLNALAEAFDVPTIFLAILSSQSAESGHTKSIDRLLHETRNSVQEILLAD